MASFWFKIIFKTGTYTINALACMFIVSVFKCLTLKTVHGRKIFHTWEEIERLVAEKKVDVTQVVTHRFPMSQFEEAFKVLFDGSACKIIMDPSK